MSGLRSFTSLIARWRRFGTKCGPPQCKSEICAIVSIRARSVPVRRRWYPGSQMLLETPDFQAYVGVGQPRFANQAELECAKILDFHGVPWDYEPTDVRARARRGRPRGRGVLARLLPPRAGPLHRDHGDEAVARHPQEPQAAQAQAEVPGRQRSSSSTSATSSDWRSDTGSSSRADRRPAGRRPLPLRGGDRCTRRRAGGRDHGGLRRARAAPRRAAQGERRLPRRPLARARRPARARVRRAGGVRPGRDARRPFPDPAPQGPRASRSRAGTS